MSQSALQREERFIHGLVHQAADRLGQTQRRRLPQPMVESFALAFDTRASCCLSGADAMYIGTVFLALLHIPTFLRTL